MVGYQCDELGGYTQSNQEPRTEDQDQPILHIRIGVIPVEEHSPKMSFGLLQVLILCAMSAIMGICFYRAVTSTVKYISENQNERHAEISNDTVHLQQGK